MCDCYTRPVVQNQLDYYVITYLYIDKVIKDI